VIEGLAQAIALDLAQSAPIRGHPVRVVGGSDYGATEGSNLVIQGDQDDIVPPAHGRFLYERGGEPRTLLIIRGADHRLTDPLHRLEAVEQSRGWFARHLAPRRLTPAG